MKTPDDVVQEARRRLERTWQSVVCGDTAGWPLKVVLGRPGKDDFAAGFQAVQAWAVGWRTWGAGHGVEVLWENRDVHGTRQSLPTHAVFNGADQAAALVGSPWPERLAKGRARCGLLSARFPDTFTPAIIRETDAMDDTDFSLLLTAAGWFRDNDASGLTARQVPIEGLHSKWLNRNRKQVLVLAGTDSLGLVDRPTRVHVTYLDPDHLAAGGRRYDSITAGDHVTPAYEPAVVVISENKDTAMFFPHMDGGVAVEGGGMAVALIAGVSWLANAPRIYYWGDMDAAGYEIVDRLRASGVRARTILMDMTAYREFEQFGARTDDAGKPLPCPARRPIPSLTAEERAVYETVTDPEWIGPRRIEQERIPLHDATRSIRLAGADTSEPGMGFDAEHRD